MKLQLLGNLPPRAFLQRYWQKRPLFVRGAIPGFRGAVPLAQMRSLAARDDVESRIVQRRGRRYVTRHGPFARLSAGRRDFTLLVSGMNLHDAAAEALLRRFAFIPQARLDDVMVSFATPGGGVGPHVDSYDVFLVQGAGRRRWRVWSPKGSLHGEFACEDGDLLYLPPGWRHDGVALEPCYTYSVGFRAPKGAELAARFLDWLHERGLPDATYRDPGLRPAARSGAIPREMIDFAGRVARRIRWNSKDLATFLGQYLSEPKPHVVFKAGGAAKKTARLEHCEVRLDPKTQLLYSGRQFFINGESFSAPARPGGLLRELADRRRLDGRRAAGSGLAHLLYDWRRCGFLQFIPKIPP